MCVIVGIEHRFQPYEVSILIFCQSPLSRASDRARRLAVVLLQAAAAVPIEEPKIGLRLIPRSAARL
jgi:hypothetical protein